jgi:hypothetical protein
MLSNSNGKHIGQGACVLERSGAVEYYKNVKVITDFIDNYEKHLL